MVLLKYRPHAETTDATKNYSVMPDTSDPLAVKMPSGSITATNSSVAKAAGTICD